MTLVGVQTWGKVDFAEHDPLRLEVEPYFSVFGEPASVERNADIPSALVILIRVLAEHHRVSIEVFTPDAEVNYRCAEYLSIILTSQSTFIAESFQQGTLIIIVKKINTLYLVANRLT